MKPRGLSVETALVPKIVVKFVSAELYSISATV
jgi:hypothetical protein